MWRIAILMFVFIYPRTVHATGACDSNPCLNGALCEPASYDSNSFQCETNCPSNCYGQQCETCVAASSVCASCPSGFTQAVPGSCFAISPGSYSFIDADAYCISVGGRLASVNDAIEDYEIRRVLGDGTEYMPFWIGSGDPNSIGAYTWIDGSSSTYSTREHISGYCCTILKLGYMAPPLQWFLFQCIEAYQAMCRLPCGASGACASNPCQNGATCELASYDSSSFQCEMNCPSNCYGQQCEVCVPAASVCASCPSGFTQAVPGSCFAISPGSYSFIDADAYCISVGGRLATVNDATEDYEIRRVLGDGTEYMPFWIGSGDPNSIGAYTWIDGSSSTYSTREHISGYCCTILKLGYMAPPLQWFLFQCIEAYQAMCRLPCGASGACASNPCQNGATCELASYDSSSFQCETNCPSNCYGQLCEVCVPAASVCASCPSGFTQAVPGSCFAISPGSYSFIDADAYCISVGGRLATVNDATEDYEIRRVLGDGTEYMPFWIGSGDPNSIGAYTWIDGSSSTYSTREHISGYCCTILKLGYMAPPLQWFLFQCIEAYQAMCRLNCGSSK